MRPTLLPNLRRLWRDAQTLQLGSDPDQAVVLRLARPAASRALDLLDGSATISGLVAGAGKLGLDGRDVEEIVDLLRRLGLVLGAHELTPSSLPEGVRRRLHIEAAAIALRRRTDPRATTRHADQQATSRADQQATSRADQQATSGPADQPRTTASTSQEPRPRHAGQNTATGGTDQNTGQHATTGGTDRNTGQDAASRAEQHAASGSIAQHAAASPRTNRRGTTPIARPAAARREQPRSPTPAEI